MSKENVTFRVDTEKKLALDALAAGITPLSRIRE
jgi:hypothetical protein